MTKRAKGELTSEPADSGARFAAVLGRILTVSKEELTKREAAYQKSRPRKSHRARSR